MSGDSDRQNILIATVLMGFGTPLALTAIPVALPSIAIELPMSAVQMGWVSLAFSLTLGIFALPFGRLADIWGRKKFFTIGLAVGTIAMILSALSSFTLMLILSQALQGIGFAMVLSTGVALLSSAYSTKERGRVLGIYMAAVYFGMSFGPTVGGLLTYNFGWRSIFAPAIALLIPTVILIVRGVKGEWAEAKGETLDILGSALLSFTLFLILYGFSSLPSQLGIILLITGILFAILFIVWEMKTKSPVLNIRLMVNNRLFAFSSVTHLLHAIATFPVPFIMSLYLQYIKELNPQQTGFILLTQPFVMAIFSPIAGRVSDRMQPRVLVSIAGVTILFGIVLLLFSTTRTTLITIVASLFLIGLGYAFFASPDTNAIMSSVDSRHYGIASAVESTTRSVGITLGMAILMMLFSLHIGTSQITAEYFEPFVKSVRTAFAIYCGLSVCFIVTSATRGKVVIHK